MGRCLKLDTGPQLSGITHALGGSILMTSSVNLSLTYKHLLRFGQSHFTAALRHQVLRHDLLLRHFGVDTTGGLLPLARPPLRPLRRLVLDRHSLPSRLVPLANHTGHFTSCHDTIEGSSRLGIASVKPHCLAPCLRSSSPPLHLRHS